MYGSEPNQENIIENLHAKDWRAWDAKMMLADMDVRDKDEREKQQEQKKN